MKQTNVVILDDEQNILSSLMRLLRGEPYGVFVTTEPEAALRALREFPVKVVMTDQRMPKTTGVEFLLKVREAAPDAVRILFTGYSDIQAVEDAINKGNVYRFINKPWNDEELKAALRQAVEHHDLAAENARLLEVTRRQNEELRHLDRLKSDFIANVSHELRTPLNTINLVMGNIKTGIAGDPSAFPEKLRTYLGMIDRNTENLRRLINDLLDIFKLTSEGFSLVRSPVDIARVATEECEAMKMQAEAKMITLHVSSSPVPPLMLDEARLRQVMRNLLSNAVKFTPGGGSVNVSLEMDDASVLYKVSDTGIGIDASDLERIFDRFNQIEQKATGKPKGTGLGLAISRKIVELHGGSLHAESIAGQGSTFIVKIPAAGEAGAAPLNGDRL